MVKVWPHLRRRSGHEDPPARPGTTNRFRAISTAFAMLFALFAAMPFLFRDPEEGLVDGVRVTACDRLAAHPSDTNKLAPGVEQADVDIPAARRACHRALEEQPEDGRILYQLGRTYFYNDEKDQGIAYFRRSAAAGYAQGQFVFGLILVQGNGAEPDACAGGRLWVDAARQHHLYSKIYLGQNWMDGLFGDCGLPITAQEIDGMVSAAEALADTPDQKDDVTMLRTNWDEMRKQSVTP